MELLEQPKLLGRHFQHKDLSLFPPQSLTVELEPTGASGTAVPFNHLFDWYRTEEELDSIDYK